jgi:hypothetical protein
MLNSFTTAVLALALTTPAIQACSCLTMPNPDYVKIRDQVEVVFQGRIVGRSFPYGDAVFQVSRVWQGPVGEQFVVQWRRGDSGDCNGFWSNQLKVGAELIVFASRRGGVYRTDICLPTKLVSDAADEIAALGPGRKPDPRK